jgi:RNA polymerase sigma factor (sigma-70 family)
MDKRIEKYIVTNYQTLKSIAKKITKTSDDIHQDLLQEVILQLYEKDIISLKSYDDNSIKYYITAVMRINYYSKTSPFYYKIRRHRILMSVDIQDCFNMEYEQENFETEELFQLLECEYAELDWFKKSLLDMYLSLNSSMKAVSRKTTIPLYSISRYFKEIRTDTKNNILKKLNR